MILCVKKGGKKQTLVMEDSLYDSTVRKKRTLNFSWPRVQHQLVQVLPFIISLNK